MTYGEFRKIRRCSKYKLGDKVYFEMTTGYNEYCLPVQEITVGIIVDLPDNSTVFYGVRPIDTDEDTYCRISVRAENMRKVRK